MFSCALFAKKLKYGLGGDYSFGRDKGSVRGKETNVWSEIREKAKVGVRWGVRWGKTNVWSGMGGMKREGRRERDPTLNMSEKLRDLLQLLVKTSEVAVPLH